MLAALNWPPPHHMKVIDADPTLAPEPGVITLNDGTKLECSVLHIDFEAGVIEFFVPRSAGRSLPFKAFRSLCLTRAIELESVPLAVPLGSVEAFPKREKYQCTVVFRDGATLELNLAAILPRKSGLFLFAIDQGRDILRWFIPANAVKTYRIGEQLGQALRGHKLLASDALEDGLKAQQHLQNKRIGDYLTEQGAVTRQDLESALVRQKSKSLLKLGDALVQERFITVEQRDAALATQASDRSRLLGDILVSAGAVTREDVRRVLVEQLGVPSVNVSRYHSDPNALKAISAELARKYSVVPLYRTSTRIAVAIENPLWSEALQQLEFFTGLKVDPAMAAREDLLAAVVQYYGAAPAVDEIAQIVAKLDSEKVVSQVDEGAVITESDNTLVRLVNKIIMDAYDMGASDIHIESMPNDKPSLVRFRVDSVLTPYITVPANFRAALISRLKIMCDLDISERRRPQDGKIHFEEFGPRKLELRVVTMPTANGLEDVVMRLLAAPSALKLEQLSLSPRNLPALKEIVAKSYGLLLVCGPTGSGKTTTLHSLLAHVNTPQHKIWTVEDPIEITQEGLCQVQVNVMLGLTFPAVLRSFLRADPDIIMVGEMRDAETARTVVAASLTGHLVLSTMHTNSAVESVIRLLDLGLDPFNFADALLGVIGQRLVRKLCIACRVERLASDDEIQGLAHDYCIGSDLDPAAIATSWRSRYGSGGGAITVQSPVGCKVCDRSGYKGRMGVHELLLASPEIKALIQTRVPNADILRAAIRGGMVTLKQDAIEKVLQGHLDYKQVKASTS